MRGYDVCTHCSPEIWLYVYQFHCITVHLSSYTYSSWSHLRRATCAVARGDTGLLSVQLSAFVMTLTPLFSPPGFPNEPAADIALDTVKKWIKDNPDEVGHAEIIHALNRKLSIWKLRICAIPCVFVEFGWVKTQNTNFRASLYQTYYPPASLDQAFSLQFACTSN